MAVSVRIKRGTAAAWTAANTVLALGEQGYETDTRKMKVGDGSTVWNSLSYVVATAVMADGDKGDITVSGAGTALNIDADVVTNAKLANMDTGRIKGRITAAVGDPEDLTAAQAKTVLAITSTDISNFNEAAQDAVGAMVDNATIEYIDATPLMRVKADGIQNSHLADAPAFTLKGNLTGGSVNPGDNNMAAVKSALAITSADISNFAEAAQDAVGGGFGGGLAYDDTGGTFSVADNGITNAKLNDMATARIKGRVTAATGDPEDLTGTQATTLLDLFTSLLKGLVPASGGGFVNFLRADGSWVPPVEDLDRGDIVTSNNGQTFTIDNDIVSNAKLANMSANTIKGRRTSVGDPEDLTGTQVTALLDVFTSLLKGLVPASGGGTANYLRADGGWVAPIVAVPAANWPPATPQTDILYLKVP